VKFLVLSHTRFAVFETLPILFGGQHSLRIHYVLRMPTLPASGRSPLTKISSPSGKTPTPTFPS
jgi:hypothetical protein